MNVVVRNLAPEGERACWRILVDGVSVAWAVDPSTGSNPLADELATDPAKAAHIRDFWREQSHELDGDRRTVRSHR